LKREAGGHSSAGGTTKPKPQASATTGGYNGRVNAKDRNGLEEPQSAKVTVAEHVPVRSGVQ